MPRSSEWSLPFRFTNKNILCISSLSHACYMSRPSRPPWFGHPNNTWWSVQVVKLLIMQSYPASRHFLRGPNFFLRILLLNTINLRPYENYKTVERCFHHNHGHPRYLYLFDSYSYITACSPIGRSQDFRKAGAEIIGNVMEIMGRRKYNGVTAQSV
jgi:hypothetical protein